MIEGMSLLYVGHTSSCVSGSSR